VGLDRQVVLVDVWRRRIVRRSRSDFVAFRLLVSLRR
jgi:hypothetical protein